MKIRIFLILHLRHLAFFCFVSSVLFLVLNILLFVLDLVINMDLTASYNSYKLHTFWFIPPKAPIPSHVAGCFLIWWAVSSQCLRWTLYWNKHFWRRKILHLLCTLEKYCLVISWSRKIKHRWCFLQCSWVWEGYKSKELWTVQSHLSFMWDILNTLIGVILPRINWYRLCCYHLQYLDHVNKHQN